MCVVSNKLFCTSCNSVTEAEPRVKHCDELARLAREQPSLWRHPQVGKSSNGIRQTCPDVTYNMAFTATDEHCRNIARRQELLHSQEEKKRRIGALKVLERDREQGTTVQRPGLFKRMTSSITNRRKEKTPSGGWALSRSRRNSNDSTTHLLPARDSSDYI